VLFAIADEWADYGSEAARMEKLPVMVNISIEFMLLT
jgi:hypothetical protein